LLRTQKDVVGASNKVTGEVKKEMFGIIVGLPQRLMKTSLDVEDDDAQTVKEKGLKGMGSTRNIFKTGISSYASINQLFKKDHRETTCKDVARIFYENKIPFNVVSSKAFRSMFGSALKHGPGFKQPSYHEIKVNYSNEEVRAKGRTYFHDLF